MITSTFQWLKDNFLKKKLWLSYIYKMNTLKFLFNSLLRREQLRGYKRGVKKAETFIDEEYWNGFTNEHKSGFFHWGGASQMNLRQTEFSCMSIKNYLHCYQLWRYKIAQRPWKVKNPIESESANPGGCAPHIA